MDYIESLMLVIAALIGLVLWVAHNVIIKSKYKDYKYLLPAAAGIIGAVLSIVFSFVYDLSAWEAFITLTQGIAIGGTATGGYELIKGIRQFRKKNNGSK